MALPWHNVKSTMRSLRAIVIRRHWGESVQSISDQWHTNNYTFRHLCRIFQMLRTLKKLPILTFFGKQLFSAFLDPGHGWNGKYRSTKSSTKTWFQGDLWGATFRRCTQCHLIWKGGGELNNEGFRNFTGYVKLNGMVSWWYCWWILWYVTVSGMVVWILWYVTVLRFKSGFSQPVFLQVVQSVIGRVDVDDTGGHQTKTSKTRSILEGKNMQKQFLLFQICYLPFNLCFLKLFLVDFFLPWVPTGSEAQLLLEKNSSQLLECMLFHCYAYSEVPWVFLSSARWFECFKNGCLGRRKNPQKNVVSRVIIFAYLRKPKSTDRPSERASRQWLSAAFFFPLSFN